MSWIQGLKQDLWKPTFNDLKQTLIFKSTSWWTEKKFPTVSHSSSQTNHVILNIYTNIYVLWLWLSCVMFPKTIWQNFTKRSEAIVYVYDLITYEIHNQMWIT